MSESQTQSLEYFLNLPGPGYLVSMPYYMKFSRHVYFAILRKFYVLNHVNFARFGAPQFTFHWQCFLTCS